MASDACQSPLPCSLSEYVAQGAVLANSQCSLVTHKDLKMFYSRRQCHLHIYLAV